MLLESRQQRDNQLNTTTDGGSNELPNAVLGSAKSMDFSENELPRFNNI